MRLRRYCFCLMLMLSLLACGGCFGQLAFADEVANESVDQAADADCPRIVSVQAREGSDLKVFDTCTEEEFIESDFCEVLTANMIQGAGASDTGLYKSQFSGLALDLYESLETARPYGLNNTMSATIYPREGQSLEELYDEISGLYSAVMFAYQRDHLEDFCFLNPNEVKLSVSYRSTSLLVNLTYTPSKYYSPSLEESVKNKIDEVVKNCSASERFNRLKYYHDWLVNTNVYDLDTSRIASNDGSRAFYYAHSHIGCLINGTGVCESYAKSFSIFCKRENIPCLYVTSTGHAFNYVKMEDGQWYMVDCTFDDPVSSRPVLSYSYFLVSNNPYVDSGNHLPDHALLYPETSMSDYASACNWVEVSRTPATCLTDGQLVQRCSICSATRTKVLPATSHDWKLQPVEFNVDYSKATINYVCSVCQEKNTTIADTTIISRKDASCTWSGSVSLKYQYTVHLKVTPDLTTNTTNTSSKTITLPALGHDFGSEVVTAPGCTTSGSSVRTCRRCSYQQTTTMSSLGHDYSKKLTREATCISAAVYQYLCKRCGDTFLMNEGSARGHQVSVAKASPSEDGYLYHCSGCDFNNGKINRPAVVTLSATKYIYTGKAIKPSVQVYDEIGQLIDKENYKLTYTSNISVGTAYVTVTFQGDYYTGSIKKSFKILGKPKTTSLTTLTPGSKKFTAQWKKQTTNTTGYQLQYSLKSDFSSKTSVLISSTGTVKKTISGLKSKKKYYVRIRTYRTVNSKKYYSAWSAKKSVTTK